MKFSDANDAPAAESGEGSFAEFLHSWRYFLWLLGLVVVFALLFAEENWRGQRAWDNYKREMAARGEPLERATYVPAKVPDDQNFAMTPLLAPLFQFALGSSPGMSPLNGIGLFASNYDAASRELKAASGPRSNSWIRARTDLPDWYAGFLNSTNKHAKQKALFAATNFTVREAATGVIGCLAEAEPVFEELRAANKLPYARFNVHYDDEDPAGILLPHLAVVKNLSQVADLRACAELALGQTEEAFEDTRLLLRLADVFKDEPFLISQLVRMAQFSFALQPIAEGMRQWSEPQLLSFQTQLAQFDFCADAMRGLRAERFFGSVIVDYVRNSRDKVGLISGISGGQQSGLAFAPILMSVAPTGWYNLEQLNCCRMTDELVLPTIDPAARQIRPQLSRKADEAARELTGRSFLSSYLHHRFFCGLLVPGTSKIARKAALAQTAADCATIACALERYRRQYHQVPESLEALKPQFIEKLPHDIINGAALKYRRTDAEQYVLYSVGWNEIDDGGVVAEAKNRDENAVPRGDWVWQLP